MSSNLSDVDFEQQAAESVAYLSVARLLIMQRVIQSELKSRPKASCDVCGELLHSTPEGFQCMNPHPVPDHYCALCKEPQYQTPSGLTCLNGHGGADSLTKAEQPTFKLTDDQERAWGKIQDWYKGTHPYFVLRGFAGTGKCVSGETLLGNQHGLLTMRELFTHYKIPITSYPTEVCSEDLSVHTPSGSLPISGFYTKKVHGYMKIRPASSPFVRCTPNHRVKTITSDGLVWKLASEIVPGDLLVGTTTRNTWQGKSTSLLADRISVIGNLRSLEVDYRVQTKVYKTPTKLTSQLARLLGYLVADAHMGRAGFTISKSPGAVQDDLIGCVKSCFPDFPASFLYAGNEKAGIAVRSKFLRIWLHYACGFSNSLTTCKSRHKQVPLIIRTAPKALVLEFLSAYLSCDSEFTSIGVGICSASRKLVDQLVILMSYFGAVPSKMGSAKGAAKNGSGILRRYYGATYPALSFVPLLSKLSIKKVYPEWLTSQDQRRLPVICVEAWRTLRKSFFHSRNKVFVRLEDGSIERCSRDSLRLGLSTSRTGMGDVLTRRSLEGTNWELAARINSKAAKLLQLCLQDDIWISEVKQAVFVNKPLQVFDICVPGKHEFLAGGMVHHNTYIQKKLLDLPGNWHFSAPTNKATKVLSDFVALPCKTIYSLLGLKMTAEEDVLKLTASRDAPDLGNNPIIVIDEAGMVPKLLSDMIQKLVAKKGWRVMFVGDPAQLNPVGETISPVWKLAHPEHNALMREVKRFDNELLALSVAVRTCLREKQYDLTIDNHNSNGEGVFVVPASEFTQQIKAVTLNEWSTVKIICWRNKTVEKYNDLVRKSLGFTEKYHVGERLLIGAPILSNKQVIAHTDEEVEILSVDKRIFNFPEGPIHVTCLSLQDRGYKLFVPDNPGVLESYLAKRAATASASTGIHKKKAWASFWELKDTFQSVRYGYCLTAHRAQGSTFKTVFVDVADITANKNKREAYRCLYVAATRPTSKLITF